MAHIYNGILLGHEKEQNLTFRDSMDKPGRYNTKWNKSDRKIQIPDDFS